MPLELLGRRISLDRQAAAEVGIIAVMLAACGLVPYAVGIGLHRFTAYDVGGASAEGPVAFWAIGLAALIVAGFWTVGLVALADFVLEVESVD